MKLSEFNAGMRIIRLYFESFETFAPVADLRWPCRMCGKLKQAGLTPRYMRTVRDIFPHRDIQEKTLRR